MLVVSRRGHVLNVAAQAEKDRHTWFDRSRRIYYEYPLRCRGVAIISLRWDHGGGGGSHVNLTNPHTREMYTLCEKYPHEPCDCYKLYE